MSDEVSLCLSDPIEEPVLLIRGEGSGAECTVGNGEEKKKIFFFGQPGCLKHSPIKTSPNEDQNNHKVVTEGGSGTASKVLGNHKSAVEEAVVKKVVDDDENGDSLLQKISEVLGDEPDASSNHVQNAPALAFEPVVSELPQNIDATKSSESELKVEKKPEISNQNCANEEVLEKKLEPIEKNDSKLDNNDSVSINVVKVDCEKSNFSEKVEDAVAEKTNPLRSIVPYDDDSTSSSSQLEVEAEKPKLSEGSVDANESAYEQTGTSLEVDLEKQEGVAEEKAEENPVGNGPEVNEISVAEEKSENAADAIEVTPPEAEVLIEKEAEGEVPIVKEAEASEEKQEELKNNEIINESVEIGVEAEEIHVEQPKIEELVSESNNLVQSIELPPTEQQEIESVDEKIEDACESRAEAIEELPKIEPEASSETIVGIDVTLLENKIEEAIIETPPAKDEQTESHNDTPIEKESQPVIEVPAAEEILAVDESAPVVHPASEESEQASIENFINANAEVVEEELPSLEQVVEHPQPSVDAALDITAEISEGNVESPPETAEIPPVGETESIAPVVDHEICKEEEETVVENENKLKSSGFEEEVSSEDKVASRSGGDKIEIEEPSADNEDLIDNTSAVDNRISDNISKQQSVAEEMEEKFSEPASDEDSMTIKEVAPAEVENLPAESAAEVLETIAPEDSEEKCLPAETEAASAAVLNIVENIQSIGEISETKVPAVIEAEKVEDVQKSLSEVEDDDESEPELHISEPLQSTPVPDQDEDSEPADTRVEPPETTEVEEKAQEIAESPAPSLEKVPETIPTLNAPVEDEESDDDQNDFPADDVTGGDSEISDSEQKSPEADSKEIEVPGASNILEKPEISHEEPESVSKLATVESSVAEVIEAPAPPEFETPVPPVVETSAPLVLEDLTSSAVEAPASPAVEILEPPAAEISMTPGVKAAEPAAVKSPSPVNEILEIPKKVEQAPFQNMEEVDQSSSKSEDVKAKVEIEEDPLKFTKPPVTRKRKISERKSVSESDSDGNIVTDTVSHDNSSEEEEAVQKKKPRMRGKTTTPRKAQPRRAAAAASKKPVEAKKEVEEDKKPEEATLQNLKFDYDENEDVAAKVAAIRTMISKDSGVKKESDSDSSDDGSERKAGNKRSRRTRGGRASKRGDSDSSDEDEKPAKKGAKNDSKRSKTQDESKDQTTPTKKRQSGGRGLLKYIDTSLVIDTTENEAPVRQSRRIAQQKVREETERRQIEEKMLKQMKAQAVKKTHGGTDDDDVDAEIDENESSGDDESFKGSRRKKKSKIKPADKQWQTSSSHSERSESDDYMEHHYVPSDPGSPLFKSDHEFSPESDDDDAAAVMPIKRARTAKKLEAVKSSDEEEDINPNHACQVCHKTDSPEWILLCDECDCGYHCSCLKPIIFLIPSGNWYCPLCCHKKLIANLSEQLTQLDTLIYNIETIELKKERQKQAELNEQKIVQERRKQKAEAQAASKQRSPSKSSSGSSSSGDSSEDEPLGLYKLRKRNQAAAPSYRFNEYDDLINSAIKRDMDGGSKTAGNLGRGKDISTIIEAEQEDDQLEEVNEEAGSEDEAPEEEKKDGAESSGSEVIRPKKVLGKKKKKKLNNLDVSSEEEGGSDEDFKGSTPSSDSEVDEEDLSMSSVSESSLDLPLKKSKGGRNVRKSTRNRETRSDRRFINDGDTDSDDEPLIRAKRSKKKDSDEEEFDLNDDDDEEGSLAEDIDSEDLCDDTDTEESSDDNWAKKKKKRVASYDPKPRKAPKKKDDNEDKAFRAGISKKKVLKKSDNESEASASESEKGKRKTRGKKLLYLIEDDLDSDESDGIKPGVKRPETPPEEREMFFKKQEEIKRMLAAKDTEAAKKLAAPTIMPINIAMEKPATPPIPFSNEPASLSTIPKNVIESAKALDTDYNRIKPIVGGMSRGALQSNDMNEEELARMMEEEDFAQHQLKLAGEAIARKKLLDLEAKESQEFAAYTKAAREKEWPPAPPTAVAAEAKKRSRKSKSSEKSAEEFQPFPKASPTMPPQMIPSNLGTPPMPPLVGSNMPPQHLHKPPMHQSIIANLMQQQPPHTSFNPMPPSLSSERPSVLSNFLSRPPEMHRSMPPDAYNPKNQQLPAQPYEDEEKKKAAGRRKKFTPLRTDLPEGNISKQPKLDQPSVIQPPIMNPGLDRLEEKGKVPRPEHPKLAVAPPPQIFNPATNPTPSVITRLLQPSQRPGLGPYGQGFQELGPAGENLNARMYPSPEEMKNASPGKPRGAMPPVPMPQGAFGENPFVPRNIHPLYRGPPGYAMPPHARLPPYPFHHLHPNLRPGEYSTPYNIPPQFSYYAPPAHSRQPPQSSAIPLNHGPPQHVGGPEDISNSIRMANNSEENPSETSEFGGLVSYFSSQQELD